MKEEKKVAQSKLKSSEKFENLKIKMKDGSFAQKEK